MKRIVLAAAVLVNLVGCAVVPGPGVVGNGDWLQVYHEGKVVYEMNTRAAGHQACLSQATMIQNKNPARPNLVKCSHEATRDPLPFSYTAHIRRGNNDQLPSSPYTVKTASKARCLAALKADASMEMTVILENRCK